MLCDVARGLHYLHWLPKQVVHNDIKAPNVLVTSSVVAKLCDFGLASWRSFTTLFYTEHEQVQPRGQTYAYLCPEKMSGSDINSAKADVYSYGMVMWEVFSESVPFEDCSPAEVERKVSNFMLLII